MVVLRKAKRSVSSHIFATKGRENMQWDFFITMTLILVFSFINKAYGATRENDEDKISIFKFDRLFYLLFPIVGIFYMFKYNFSLDIVVYTVMLSIAAILKMLSYFRYKTDDDILNYIDEEIKEAHNMVNKWFDKKDDE